MSLKEQADARMAYLKPPGNEKTVADLFGKKWVLDRISGVLPKHLTAERLAKIAIQCINKTPKLLECSQMSLVQSVLHLAELGLEPSSLLGLANIVPYGPVAQAQIGYRGYIALARRSGGVGEVRCELVYEKDRVEDWHGLERHYRIFPHPSYATRGKITQVYCVADLLVGTTVVGQSFARMFIEEVEEIRLKYASDKSPAWNNPQSYPEMVKKTCVRRAQKFWPLSPEMYETLEKAEQYDSDKVVDGEVTKGGSTQVQVPAEMPDFGELPASTGISQTIEEGDVVSESVAEEGASSTETLKELVPEDAPPPQIGPEEVCDAVLAEMRAAPDLKSRIAAANKGRGLPKDLEAKVMALMKELTGPVKP